MVSQLEYYLWIFHLVSFCLLFSPVCVHCTYFPFGKYPDGIFSIGTSAGFWSQHRWMQILSRVYVCFKIISVLSKLQNLRLPDSNLFPYSYSVCDSWFSPWLIRIAFNLTNLKLILVSETKWWLPPIINVLHLARNFVI